jgi:FkbM family methyltransferase
MNMKTFIQIGANVGNDDFSAFLRTIKDRVRVFLVEPNTHLLEALRVNYSELSKLHEVHIKSVGVVPDPKFNALYLDYLDTGGCSSVLKRKTLPRIHTNVKLSFPAYTFDNFCIENGIAEIDFLSIDTEGCDYAIINSIDLKKYPIRRIECEVWIHENDDLSAQIPTGPTFFETVIVPKMSDYNISTKRESDGQETHVFIRK